METHAVLDRPRPRRRVLVLIAAAALLVVQPLAAQEPTEAEDFPDTWSFALVPYLWGAGVSGSLTINDLTSEVDVGVDEILQNLDLALMLKVEASKGRWSIGLDGFYAGLKYVSDRPDSDVTIDQWLVEAYGAYWLTPWLGALAGARYNGLTAEITFDEPVGRQRATGINWIDPIVGARVDLPLGGRWAVRGRGDVGGFGVGSEFAWQLQAFVDFRISRVVSIDLGYRAVSNDYEKGSGDNRFRYDMRLHGPALGVFIRL